MEGVEVGAWRGKAGSGVVKAIGREVAFLQPKVTASLFRVPKFALHDPTVLPVKFPNLVAAPLGLNSVLMRRGYFGDSELVALRLLEKCVNDVRNVGDACIAVIQLVRNCNRNIVAIVRDFYQV